MKALKVLLIPVFVVACAVLYAHALETFSGLVAFTPPGKWAWVVYFVGSFLSAMVVALVACPPLVRLYKGEAVYLAAVMTLPVLYLRADELTNFARSPISIAVSLYEIGAFVVLLVLGTFLLHRSLMKGEQGEMPLQTQ